MNNENILEKPALGYDPESLERELKPFYIGASEVDIDSMLSHVGSSSLEELFSHIPSDILFEQELHLPDALEYNDLQDAMWSLSSKNNLKTSFIGDGLPHWKTDPIVGKICGIRNLATSYTPYQPERSQGTLATHWIYQCLLSKITGFEAVNSSLYERSTAIFEAIQCATRLKRKTNVALVAKAIYPGDKEVLNTTTRSTNLKIEYIPYDLNTGLVDTVALHTAIEKYGNQLAAFVFPQVNTFGLCEDVDALTNICAKAKIKSIAIFDPALIVTGGLKAPTEFGEEGADMIVGEGQHLAIGPNFGGPGLGIFGIRHTAKNKNDIRSTPGRFVGKGKDEKGRTCRVMILSTREQHIRKEKATSNICSNQAFLATIAGASLLTKGEEGMTSACANARKLALKAAIEITQIDGFQLAFPKSAFFNEFVISSRIPVSEIIQHGSSIGIHIGVDASDRSEGHSHLIKLSFSDIQSETDVNDLVAVFSKFGDFCELADPIPKPSESLLRYGTLNLPSYSREAVESYYNRLGEQNISPDTTCYPLGSCTMKYNPYINEWAAALTGFAESHPQAPIEDVQGNLEVLFETQEWFKAITGLPGITTQPVAGAQGELVGIKLFQAYFKDKGELERDILLVPKSAHGTNFATATMAGFINGKTEDGRTKGIVLLDADSSGRVDMSDFRSKIDQYGPHIAGIMVTNPNTGGIFEVEFKPIADAIHKIGGLVYMDGANMNAIAGWLDLNKMGVDAVHNNLHKTWTIPHGGGGPGDAIVGVSEKLIPFLPGYQIIKEENFYRPVKMEKSIGSFHRHWGNFGHKIRCFTYLRRLGKVGVRKMSALSVLSARYLLGQLKEDFPSLPYNAESEPRMHEFILTLSEEMFQTLEEAGIPKSQAIASVGKLFLDFGYHSPTVAFPEVFGLMLEPTETYGKNELDRFVEAVRAIKKVIEKRPDLAKTAPHFTPINRVDEVSANRVLTLSEELNELPNIIENRIRPRELQTAPIDSILKRLFEID